MEPKKLRKDLKLTRRLLISLTSPGRKLSVFLNGVKRAIFLVRVEGESAWPELVSGKTYFAASFLKPKIGDFIVFKNPKDQKEILVKKIRSIRKNSYFAEGTLPWAKSSRDFGQVSKGLILGKILFA